MLTWLSMIPNSIFSGRSLEEIAEVCSYNDARRYLTELILLNDRNKSYLFDISEHGSSNENCSVIQVDPDSH